MCGWLNSRTTSFRKHVLWLRIQPNSRFIKGSILKYDHTTMSQNGNYLVMPLAMAINAYSSLTSPLLKFNVNSICFQMWYFAMANNSSIPALNVRLVDISRRKSNILIRLNATQNVLNWTLFQTEFTNLPAAFNIQIETMVGSQEVQSDIGIDDISIQMGGCGGPYQPPTSTTPVPATEKVLDTNFEVNSAVNWNYDQTAWRVGRFADRKSF